MKRNKLFGGGLLLLAALLVAAIPASASAKTLVQLTEEPAVGEVVPAPAGAVAHTVVTIDQLDGCGADAEGTVGTNPSSKVVVTATTVGAEGYEHCRAGSGVTESGHLESTTWESSGTVKIKGALKLTFGTAPTACIYEFKKFKPEAKITFPTVTGLKGATTGKLNKTESNKTKGACEKSMTTEFKLNVLDNEAEPFGAETI